MARKKLSLLYLVCVWALPESAEMRAVVGHLAGPYLCSRALTVCSELGFMVKPALL